MDCKIFRGVQKSYDSEHTSRIFQRSADFQTGRLEGTRCEFRYTEMKRLRLYLLSRLKTSFASCSCPFYRLLHDLPLCYLLVLVRVQNGWRKMGERDRKREPSAFLDLCEFLLWRIGCCRLFLNLQASVLLRFLLNCFSELGQILFLI